MLYALYSLENRNIIEYGGVSIKDGQVFNELHRGTDTRKEFFTKILEVVSVLGGEQSEHLSLIHI